MLSGITAVGTSPNADAELWDAVRGGEPVAPVYITSKRGAKLLARWGTVTGGVRTFENVRTDGTGTIDGTRVLIAPEAGAKLILLDAAALLWSDGGLSLTPSDETSIKLDTAPAATPQTMTSMFQPNSSAIRIVRTVSSALAASDGIGFIDLPVGSLQ